MIDHYDLQIRKDEWESLRKILETPHEHVESRNECPICDKSLVQDAVDQFSALKSQLDRYTRLSEIGVSLGGELEERERRMEVESQLSEITAELDNCINKNIYLTTKSAFFKRKFESVTQERDRLVVVASGIERWISTDSTK